MHVIMIRIEEHGDALAIHVDSLALEDSTETERTAADAIEESYKAIAAKVQEYMESADAP